MKTPPNMQRLPRIVVTLGLLTGIASPIAAQPAGLQEFFAGQGCAIGPATMAAALAAGFEPKAIEAFAQTALDNPRTVRTGQWLVLSADVCKIRPPEMRNVLKLSDPEVGKSISAPDAYSADGEPGCFLNPDKLLKEVQRTRSWNGDTATAEYLRLIGASVISGDMTFYTDSPVRTPVGFQLTTGRCADVPAMPAIRRSHDFLITFFDPLIRANAAHIACEWRASPMTMELPDIARTFSSEGSTNAWLGMEIQVIAMGAGWYEGTSETGKGTPRPPLCHYKAPP